MRRLEDQSLPAVSLAGSILEGTLVTCDLMSPSTMAKSYDHRYFSNKYDHQIPGV